MSAILTLLKDIRKSHERLALLSSQLDWNNAVKEWNDLSPKFLELKKVPLERLPAKERAEASVLLTELITLEKQVSARITPWIEQVQPLLESFSKHPLGSGNRENS